MPPDSTTAYLERHQPERNMHRYYRLYVTPTLFGEFALVREWGRIGKGGQRREDWYDTLEQACGERERLAGRKRRKGYCGDVSGLSGDKAFLSLIKVAFQDKIEQQTAALTCFRRHKNPIEDELGDIFGVGKARVSSIDNEKWGATMESCLRPWAAFPDLNLDWLLTDREYYFNDIMHHRKLCRKRCINLKTRYISQIRNIFSPH